MENIEAIKTTLRKCLPGGESNIKSMYLKSTNAPAVPIYTDEKGDANSVDVPNNMSAGKIKRAKLLTLSKKKKAAAAAKKGPKRLRQSQPSSKKIKKTNF